MTLSVLIVDPEIEVLGDLASRLRALGLDVSIADSDHLALERARGRRPDVFVIERYFAERTGLIDQLAADPHLGSIPRLLMAERADGEGTLSRRDAAALARGLYAALPRQRPAGREGDFRGDLSQVSVVDLLQLLSMNRRSGALTIATTKGAGEVRLQEGEVVDAVFRRQEGEKALYRLLGETEGHFAFASGTETTLRRIEAPTRMLLMEGIQHIDEVRELRDRIATTTSAFVAHHELPQAAVPTAREIVQALETPKSLDDLLEEVSDSDLAILRALEQLLKEGHVRRVAESATRAELADADRLHLLGALVQRLTRSGFGGAARIVCAGDVRRVAALGHTASRLLEAELPATSVPLAPVPHTLVTLALPGEARLELVALPLVEDMAPLWGLSLPGSAAVVHLGATSSPLLEENARVLGIPLFEAPALLGEFDETDGQQVAALLRSVLDQLAGTWG